MATKRQLDVFDKHALRIARDTLKMAPAMRAVMGGPTADEARATIARLTAGNASVRFENDDDNRKGN